MDGSNSKKVTIFVVYGSTKNGRNKKSQFSRLNSNMLETFRSRFRSNFRNTLLVSVFWCIVFSYFVPAAYRKLSKTVCLHSNGFLGHARAGGWPTSLEVLLAQRNINTGCHSEKFRGLEGVTTFETLYLCKFNEKLHFFTVSQWATSSNLMLHVCSFAILSNTYMYVLGQKNSLYQLHCDFIWIFEWIIFRYYRFSHERDRIHRICHPHSSEIAKVCNFTSNNPRISRNWHREPIFLLVLL